MSFRELKIAVVVPAFRAEDTIQKVLSGMPDWVDAIYVRMKRRGDDERLPGGVERRDGDLTQETFRLGLPQDRMRLGGHGD